MKAFVIFAIVLTVIYAIYYAVVIVQDLYGKPKEDKSDTEILDVSDMEEDESVAVNESDGGFSVGDSLYETSFEEKPEAADARDAAATERHIDVLEKLQAKVVEKMERVNPTFSDDAGAMELNKTIIARGVRPGRATVKVEPMQQNL